MIASLKEAVMSIPENLADLSYSDPLGIEVGDLTDSSVVAEDQEVDASIFGNINQRFVSSHAAFAYLIFILLYTPCVAAMGAYVREFGHKFARFIALWTMGLAYGGAALYYQATHFSQAPLSSSIWISSILLCVCFNLSSLKICRQKAANIGGAGSMILQALKSYIAEQGCVSQKALAKKFAMSEDGVDAMLQVWIRKGVISRLVDTNSAKK